MKTKNVAAITVLLISAGIAYSARLPKAAIADPREDARARARETTEIIGLIDARQFDAAQQCLQQSTTRATDDVTIVENLRLMHRLHRERGDLDAAQASLDSALREFTARPSLCARFPWLEFRIVLDKADLTAFALHDRDAAIALYDVVINAGPSALKRDLWIASQNAAMLSGDAGNFQNAIARVDALLDGPAASEVDAQQRLSLREAQASWAWKSGDLEDAYQRNLAIWNDNPNSSNLTVLDAGVFVAQMRPANKDGCPTRLSLSQELLTRIYGLHGQPATPDQPTAEQLDELERQVLVVLADSEDCGDRELSNWAKNLLRTRGQ